MALLAQVRDRCTAAGLELGLAGVSDRRGALPQRVEQQLDEITAPVLAGG